MQTIPDKYIKLLSTWFYIGYFPLAPGSMASVAGALMAMIFSSQPFLYILATAVVTVLGFKVSGRMEEMGTQKDPSCIVIDEVAGVLIAFAWLPLSWPVIITAFFLFRAFDMFKLYPVNKFDSIPGAKGIMMDDIVAGIYTNITMQLAVRWAGLI